MLNITVPRRLFDMERHYIFNRDADAILKEEELNIAVIMNSKILHFGSACTAFII
jgi:sugar/nucleoside kinase (ribokinase family)